MSEIISRTFSFKKVEISGVTGHTFYDLVRNALELRPKASQRRVEVEKDSERFRVLNDRRFLGEKNEVCVVSVFGFTMNANENAVVLNEDQESYPVEVLAPARDTEHHQEFVEGLVWAAIKDDYIAIMTSQSVSYSMLEVYFSKLFSSVMGKTIDIVFVDPSVPRYGDCDMSDAKKLTINESIAVIEEDRTDKTGVAKTYFKPGGCGWDVIKVICEAMGVKPPRMDINNKNALDKVDVSVSISMRRPSIKKGNMMDAIRKVADAFKTLDNPPIDVDFQDGRKLSQTSYRIAKVAKLPSVNKIPKVKDVCLQLDMWLREQIGQISLAGV